MKRVLKLINGSEMNQDNTYVTSAILWPLSILTAWLSSIDKSTISFALGTVVSILAIVHYVIQIKKNIKK